MLIELDDDNIIYEFYYFDLDEYTHQFASWREDLQIERFYPDKEWIIDYKREIWIS